MNISPQLILIFAIVVASLFVAVFAVAALVTARNRRIISRASKKAGSQESASGV
ncbi:MAG: hypothetical protein HDS75_00740 [Bacteroidales bacterium]|nr:hypothetical protein [Bacteroidales bacterium]